MRTKRNQPNVKPVPKHLRAGTSCSTRVMKWTSTSTSIGIASMLAISLSGNAIEKIKSQGEGFIDRIKLPEFKQMLPKIEIPNILEKVQFPEEIKGEKVDFASLPKAAPKEKFYDGNYSKEINQKWKTEFEDPTALAEKFLPIAFTGQELSEKRSQFNSYPESVKKDFLALALNMAMEARSEGVEGEADSGMTVAHRFLKYGNSDGISAHRTRDGGDSIFGQVFLGYQYSWTGESDKEAVARKLSKTDRDAQSLKNAFMLSAILTLGKDAKDFTGHDLYDGTKAILAKASDKSNGAEFYLASSMLKLKDGKWSGQPFAAKLANNHNYQVNKQGNHSFLYHPGEVHRNPSLDTKLAVLAGELENPYPEILAQVDYVYLPEEMRYEPKTKPPVPTVAVADASDNGIVTAIPKPNPLRPTRINGQPTEERTASLVNTDGVELGG